MRVGRDEGGRAARAGVCDRRRARALLVVRRLAPNRVGRTGHVQRRRLLEGVERREGHLSLERFAVRGDPRVDTMESRRRPRRRRRVQRFADSDVSEDVVVVVVVVVVVRGGGVGGAHSLFTWPIVYSLFNGP